MNTRKLIVTVVVVVSLVVAVLIANQVVAFQQPVSSVANLNYANQVFYSPNVDGIVNPKHGSQMNNQIFYSPSVEEVVNRSRATQMTNQIFYSPIIESFLH